MEERIRDKLTQALAPETLEIINESHKHQGHAGDDGSGESHFRVVIVSSGFAGLNRVERQRRVYDALTEELSGSLHALAVSAKIPGE